MSSLPPEQLTFASFGAYSLSGKRHPNEDRWVAFTHINLCPTMSSPTWQLRKKKKKKKKKKHDNEKDGAKNSNKRSDDESEVKNEESDGYLPLSFFGVYDGHGGSLCVETVCARLHKYIINQRTRSLFFLRDPDLINDTLIKEAIRRGFEDMDREVLKATEQKGDSSGSCAVVVIMLYTRIFIAHVGDTRAVLGQMQAKGSSDKTPVILPQAYVELQKMNSDTNVCLYRSEGTISFNLSTREPSTPRRRFTDDVGKGGTANARKLCKSVRTLELTEDHKAINEKEKKRMKLKGGFVVNGRVFGVLAVARAFGDRAMKMSPQEYQIRKLRGPDAKNTQGLEELCTVDSDDDSSSSDDDSKGQDNRRSIATGESQVVSSTSESTGTHTNGAKEGTDVAKESSEPNSTQGQDARPAIALSQKRGTIISTGLPFEKDEIWEWVESQIIQQTTSTSESDGGDVKSDQLEAADDASTNGKAENKPGGRTDDKQGEENGKDVKKKKKDKKKDKKSKTYESMDEKEMKRRQDKAMRKRSKQIQKEKKQLKDRERRMKEMAKIQERRGNAGEGVVVASPDIQCLTISPEDRFLFIASDGLWDVCSSKDAVKMISQLYIDIQTSGNQSLGPASVGNENKNQTSPSTSISSNTNPTEQTQVLREICETMCRTARKNGSADDVTCMLVALHPFLVG